MEVLDTLQLGYDEIIEGDVISFHAADIETDEEFDEVLVVSNIDEADGIWKLEGHSLRADIPVTYYKRDGFIVYSVLL
jgi:hypothetical protein